MLICHIIAILLGFLLLGWILTSWFMFCQFWGRKNQFSIWEAKYFSQELSYLQS